MSISQKFDFSKKASGFYVSAAASILCLITGIVYQMSYASNEYYSRSVFITLLLAVPVALVLFLCNLDGFIPAAMTLISGVAALFFIYAMYFDISVVLVGIDKQSFESSFIICSVLLVACFVLSEVSLYLKTKKED